MVLIHIKLRLWLISFISIVFFGGGILGQSLADLPLDTLNKVNKRGEKVGYWVQLVDEKLEPVDKKTEAMFYRLMYYDNEKLVDDGRHFTNDTVILKTDGNKPKQGQITMMHGKYMLFDKKERLLSEEMYDRGCKSGIHKTYDPKTGQLLEVIDFDRKYQNQNGSFYIMMYPNKKGEFGFKGYYGKKNNTWDLYSEKSTN